MFVLARSDQSNAEIFSVFCYIGLGNYFFQAILILKFVDLAMFSILFRASNTIKIFVT
jgi:hypothetical protein